MLNTPSKKQLPRFLDPRKFAQQGIEVSGDVDLSLLTRFREALSSDDGEVRAELVFGLSEQKILNLNGKVDATVQHVCQRCLGPIPLSLQCELQLAIVWDEERAVNIPKSFDPWIVGEGQVNIYEVLEDELLLGLPIVSYHEEACVPYEYFSSEDEQVAETMAKTETTNPFQVLEQLKGSLSSPKLTSRDEE